MTAECSWCTQPATEQVHMGNRKRAGTWQRVYSWLCDQCINESDRAKEASRRGR